MIKTIPTKLKLFIYVAILLLSIILFPFIYNLIPISKDANKVFHINSTNTTDVYNTLEKNGYTLTFVDKFMLETIGIPKIGWYSLDKNEYGRLVFFANMINRKTNHTMDVIVYAGETALNIMARLANDMKLDKDRLELTYETLARFEQADIFAGRYTIARDANEESTMQHIFSVSDTMLIKWKIKNLKKHLNDSQIEELYIIASIIQKESNSPKEMPLISSVIHNRLKKDMKLQMDSTLNYGKYSHVVVTPQKIKTDTSKYNTYKHKGLPPAPLGSVSIDALTAAMHPAHTKNLFFMLKPNGSHIFAATYKEHLQNIRTFREYQKKEKKKKALLAAKVKKEKDIKEKAKKAQAKKDKIKAQKLAKIKKEKAEKKAKRLEQFKRLKHIEDNNETNKTI